jgi:hypothetical protein
MKHTIRTKNRISSTETNHANGAERSFETCKIGADFSSDESVGYFWLIIISIIQFMGSGGLGLDSLETHESVITRFFSLFLLLD